MNDKFLVPGFTRFTKSKSNAKLGFFPSIIQNSCVVQEHGIRGRVFILTSIARCKHKKQVHVPNEVILALDY